MVAGGFWPARLRPDDALGDSGRDAYIAGLSNHSVEFLCERARLEAPLMNKPPATPPVFDAYAGEYDAALARGISVSGEDKEFFAQGRVRWLARRLDALKERPKGILDFGCGTGTAAPFLV